MLPSGYTYVWLNHAKSPTEHSIKRNSRRSMSMSRRRTRSACIQDSLPAPKRRRRLNERSGFLIHWSRIPTNIESCRRFYLPFLQILRRRICLRTKPSYCPMSSEQNRLPANFPDTKKLELHEVQPPAAARAVRFAAKSAPAGQRQIRAISARNVRAGHSDDTSLCQPPPAAPAKDGFGRFRVSAACGADLVCLYRASPPPSTPWLWYRPVVATPIPPSPATRGRRA